MDLGLAGRVAYVTGGSRGVGRAVVSRLLAEGAAVATCARGSGALADAFAGVSTDRLLLGSCDVEDREAVRADIARAVAHFGRLDAVVTNAGAGTVGEILQIDTEEFDAQFSIKLHSVMHVIDAARQYLVGTDEPAVVVVNGVTAHAPDPDMAAVSTARAAVASLVYLLAQRFAADGIRVNAVNLGAIVTDRQRQRHTASGAREDFAQWCIQEAGRRSIPMGRMGRPDEVAPSIALLLSPLSSYITGASLDVSGGLGVRP
jgi:NAD(P)-dependent dehydrogenase (short-subunit alcohol dehydrogenase family)